MVAVVGSNLTSATPGFPILGVFRPFSELRLQKERQLGWLEKNLCEGAGIALDTTRKVAGLLIVVTEIVAIAVVILAFKADVGRAKASLVQHWTYSLR